MTELSTQSPDIGSPESPPRSTVLKVTSRLFGSWRTAGILFPFLTIFIILSIASGPFFQKTNLLNILNQQSSLLIIAAAGTLVIVAGGLDLSVGATYGLASVVSAQLAQHHSPVIAVGAGLLVGLGIGLLNGIIVTIFRINALIATLAMSFVVGGVATLVTSGNLIVLTNQSFNKVATGSFWGVSSAVWIMIVTVSLLGILLSRTTFGRYVVASGGNPVAGRLAGVRIRQVRTITFVLSGGAAALGGVIDTARVLSAESSAGGSALAFTVLAGIVVGGTSIAGGEGAVSRTVLGVLFIALIGNGFNLLGLNALYQQIVLGAILLLAVGVDVWARSKSR
jgi:ribose transport system permease protein